MVEMGVQPLHLFRKILQKKKIKKNKPWTPPHPTPANKFVTLLWPHFPTKNLIHACAATAQEIYNIRIFFIKARAVHVVSTKRIVNSAK